MTERKLPFGAAPPSTWKKCVYALHARWVEALMEYTWTVSGAEVSMR